MQRSRLNGGSCSTCKCLHTAIQTWCMCARARGGRKEAAAANIERWARARFLFALQRQENISLTATANYPAACC